MSKKLTIEQQELVTKISEEITNELVLIIRENEKIMKRVSKDRTDTTRNSETTLTFFTSDIFNAIDKKVAYKENLDIHTALENSSIEIAKKIHKIL